MRGLVDIAASLSNYSHPPTSSDDTLLFLDVIVDFLYLFLVFGSIVKFAKYLISKIGTTYTKILVQQNNKTVFYSSPCCELL